MGIDEIRVLLNHPLGKRDLLQLCPRIDSNAQHGDDRRWIKLIHQSKRLLNRLFIFSGPTKEKIMAVVDLSFEQR